MNPAAASSVQPAPVSAAADGKGLSAPSSRRQFLKTGMTAAALLACSAMLPHATYAALAAAAPARRLALNNIHTGDSCTLTYWEHGTYVPEALTTINHVLRDHRNNQVHPMDVALLDLLTALHARLETAAPFTVISGYRSPETNAMLHARSPGVASNSLHMVGKAIDIRVAGRPLTALRNTALAMARGGVGYYPTSDFVHVDTGRVRRWVGV